MRIFQKKIVIESIADSRLFTVGYRDSNPEVAKKVADELAKQLNGCSFTNRWGREY